MSYNYKVLRGLWKVRKQTQEDDCLVHAVPIQQRKDFSFQLLFVAFALALFGGAKSYAQQVLIDPNAGGGFELGDTFQANGWTPVNDMPNAWYVGTAATPTKGARGAFISGTGGATYSIAATTNYNGGNTSGVNTSAFYRDITVPANQSVIKLSFKWKNGGQPGLTATSDRVRVYATPVSFTPVIANGAIALPGGTTPEGELTGPNDFYYLSRVSDYTTANYTLPANLAGTSFRLIIVFATSGLSTGTTYYKPAAIDEISLTSKAPSTVTSIKSGNWSDPSIWSPAGSPQGENVVISAGHTVAIDYLGDYSTTNFDYFKEAAYANNLIVNGTLTLGEASIPSRAYNGLSPSKANCFQIFGDLTVNQGGKFNGYYLGVLGSTSKTWGTFAFGGNLTNRGTMDIYGSTLYSFSNKVQTISGDGDFSSDGSLAPAFGKTMYVATLALRNYNSATPNINWGFDTKVTNGLEMKKARVQMGTKVMTLGIATTTLSQNVAMTEDAGFMPGNKFTMFWQKDQQGTDLPNPGLPMPFNKKGRFPFVNAKGENRSLYLYRTSTNGLTKDGEITVVYNDATTFTTGLNVNDAGTVITSRYDGNWQISDTGTGNTVNKIAVQAGGLNITPGAAANSNLRLMVDNTVAGTNQVGIQYPATAERLFVTQQQLTSGRIYIGMPAGSVLAPTTNTSVKSGNWDDQATWSSGVVPTCEVVTIAAGTTVTVNSAGNVSKNLSIEAGGTLAVVSGDVTVGCTLKNNVFTNNGTLNVSGGTLNINGSSTFNMGSTFIQSDGNINVDGNNGIASSSVSAGVPMMKIFAANPVNLQWMGGTLTFVNPHLSTGKDQVLEVYQYGAPNYANPSHILKFGNGSSTIAGGSIDGFRFSTRPFASNNVYTTFNLGSITVNAGPKTENRMVKWDNPTGATDAVDCYVEGNLTVNQNSTFYFPNSSNELVVGQNVVNNGELIDVGTLHMGLVRNVYSLTNGTGSNSTYSIPSTFANQSIAGTGKFSGGFPGQVSGVPIVPQKLAGINHIKALKINNTSSTGVTLKVPLTLSDWTSNGNGVLTLNNGKLNTTSVNLLTMGVNSSSSENIFYANNQTYVNGPLAKYMPVISAPAPSPSTTYRFPVGKSTAMPIILSTKVVAGTLVKVEAFETNLGTADGTTCTDLANVRWEIASSADIDATGIKLSDKGVVLGKLPVLSTTADGKYVAAFGNKAYFTDGDLPNITSTAQTAPQVPGTKTIYVSYASGTPCSGTPNPGYASANASTQNVPSVTVGMGEPVNLTLPQLFNGAVDVTSGLTYQWQKSTDNVTYTDLQGLTTANAAAVMNSDIAYYRCKVSCGAAIAYSVPVKVTLPAVPTLTFASPICAGTATYVNYSTINTAIYQLWDAPSGGNLIGYTSGDSSSFYVRTPALYTTTTYYATAMYAGAVSPRVPVVIEVSPVPSAPTANAAQTFCVTGAAPTVADLKASGAGIKWYAAVTGGTALASTVALTNGTTYYASQTPAGCESARTAVAVTINSAPQAAASQSFCTSGTVADLVATGTDIKWYTAPTGGIVLSLTDKLAEGSYYASQTVGGCETSRTLVAVTFGGGVIPSAPGVTTPHLFCSSTTLASIVPTSGTNIKWYDAANGGNILPLTTPLVDQQIYYASQTVGGCESPRFAVTASLSTPAAPTATANQSFCDAGTIKRLSDLNVTTVAGASPLYYTVATGGTPIAKTGTPPNDVYPGLVDNTTYYVAQKLAAAPGCESTQRTAVAVTYTVVSQPPLTNYTNYNKQTFCGSGKIADLVMPGLIGTVKWYDAGSAGNLKDPNDPLVNNTNYYASQTVNGCESSRTGAVNVQILTAPAKPTTTSPQTFSTNATVSYLTPNTATTKWYDAATGGNLLSANTLLLDGASYYASETATVANSIAIVACESPRSDAVLVTANAGSTVSKPNLTSPQTVCNTTTTPSGLSTVGATGTVKWYTTPTGGSVSTAAITATTTLFASQVNGSNVESADRTPVQVIVNSTAVSNPAATQAFCNAAFGSDLVPNGPGIVWYDGTTALVANTPLVDGKAYKLTSQGCAAVNTSTVTITTTPAVVPTVNTPQTLCGNKTIADLQPNTTGIKWYNQPAGGTALASTSPLVNNASYYATQTTGGCESSRSTAVVVTFTTAAPTAPATQIACGTGFVSGLSAQSSGAGYTLNWYDQKGVLISTPATTAVTQGIYFVSQTTIGCESAKVSTAVTVYDPLKPTATASQPLCGTPHVSDLIPNNPDILWYDVATGGTPKSPSDPLTGGNYYAARTLGGCTSARTTAVVVTVNPVPAVLTPSATQPSCTGKTVAALDPGTTETGATVKWYNSLTGTALATTTPLVNGNYYATQTLTGCESAKSAASAVTVNPTPATPVVSSVIQTNCTLSKGSVVLTGLPAGNWTVKNEGDSTNLASYPSDGSNPDSVVSGNTITINNLASATGNKNYKYLVTTAEGCISAKTAPININTQPLPPAAPTATPADMACEATTTSVAFEGLPDTGNWEINPGKIVGSGTTFTLNNVAIGTYDYKVKNAAGCESAAVHVVVKPRVSPPTIGSITQPTCAALGKVEFTGLPTTGWVISQSGTDVKTYSGSTATKEITLLATGTYRFTLTDNASGCISLPTEDVIIDAQPATPTKLVVTVTQPTCAVDAVAHVSGLPTGDWVIHQKSNGVPTIDIPGSGLTKDVTVTAAGTYTFTVTAASGCESEQSDEVTVNAKPAGPSAPTAGTVTAATCTTFGSVVLTGLPAEGSTVTASGGAYAPAAAEGTSYTFEGLAPGTYTFTVTNNLGCVSAASAPVTIDAPASLPSPTGDAVQTFQGAATVGDLHATGAPGTAVLWYASMEDAMANTGALLPNVPLENKSYYAMLTNGSCRSAEPLTVTVTVNLGVNQYDLAGLKYYPNPVHDLLTVTNTDMISSIEVFNLLGQRVLTARPFAIATKIDMSDLPIGTYLLKVQSEGKSGIIKVVKD